MLNRGWTSQIVPVSNLVPGNEVFAKTGVCGPRFVRWGHVVSVDANSVVIDWDAADHLNDHSDCVDRIAHEIERGEIDLKQEFDLRRCR